MVGIQGHDIAIDLKMAQVRKMYFRVWRFGTIDNFSTNRAHLAGDDFCRQRAGVYVQLLKVDNEGRTTELMWLRRETKWDFTDIASPALSSSLSPSDTKLSPATRRKSRVEPFHRPARPAY